jgi:NAD(P)-dependent dehydrogenase (short-subunit alcohol dehydrogenase family)
LVIISSSSEAKVAEAVAKLRALGRGEAEGRVLDAKAGEGAIQAFFEALPEFDHLGARLPIRSAPAPADPFRTHAVWSAGDPLVLGYPDIDLSASLGTSSRPPRLRPCSRPRLTRPQTPPRTDVFNVRTFGPLYAGKHAPRRMPQSAGSSITLTIGAVVRKPAKGWALIAAVMGATERLAKGLAVQLAPIRVNVVSPGFIRTEVRPATPSSQSLRRRSCGS